MSDVLFTIDKIDSRSLQAAVASIMPGEVRNVMVFEGDWGKMAVSENHYCGFMPYETADYLVVVVGGPLLKQRGNSFIHGSLHPNSQGSEEILDLFLNQYFDPGKDLDGPFSLWIVDKKNHQVHMWTDMMSFIPVYQATGPLGTVVGTHVDAVAETAGTADQHDTVSQVDFLLHGLVTYPYTMYHDTIQLPPATYHFINHAGIEDQLPYWQPMEFDFTTYRDIDETANELKEALMEFVKQVTDETENVAQFLSGGEDSRVLSALLQSCKDRDAMLFLEKMNREGEIAKKASDAYDANFKLITRDKRMYVDMVPQVSRLAGSGAQYFHVHTYGLHQEHHFDQYDALFGGLMADALLKGSHIRKWKGTHLLPFFPQLKRESFSFSAPFSHTLVSGDTARELQKRKEDHLAFVRSYRTTSAEEWFELWPASMNVNITNFHGNRRLFRSYEPFMSHRVVMISARTPQSWKLNRRLFQKAVKPFLEPTKHLFHGEGKLPYYPWYVNLFVHGTIWTGRSMKDKIRPSSYQGPWFEWDKVLNSPEAEGLVENHQDGVALLQEGLSKEIRDPLSFYQSSELNFVQRLNFMQLVTENHRKLNR